MCRGVELLAGCYDIKQGRMTGLHVAWRTYKEKRTYNNLSIPDFAMDLPESGTTWRRIVDARSTESRKERAVAASGSYSPGMFSGSLGFSIASTGTSDSTKSKVTVLALIQLYALAFEDDQRSQFLNDSVILKALSLVNEDGTNNETGLQDFVKNYGTHYIIKIGVGGVVAASVETSDSTNSDKLAIAANLEADFKKLLDAQGGAVVSYSLLNLNVMSNENTSFQVFGGDATDIQAISMANFMTEYPKWKQTIAKHPVPLLETIQLKDISTLLLLAPSAQNTPTVLNVKNIIAHVELTEKQRNKLASVQSMYNKHIDEYLKPSSCVLL